MAALGAEMVSIDVVQGHEEELVGVMAGSWGVFVNVNGDVDVSCFSCSFSVAKR